MELVNQWLSNAVASSGMGGRTPPYRVLVVDDDAGIRLAIQWALEDESFGVETAEDGVAALRSARQNQPDLVVLDLTLPVLNGSQVADELRSLYGSAVPILVISADDFAVEKGHRIGAYATLAKPFDVLSLVALVRQILER